ncbi:Os02g0721000, partial [Oryza sativa Japonica Group]
CLGARSAALSAFSAAAAGGEPDPAALDVVDDAERLLLRVPDDGGAPGRRERQARGGVVDVDEEVLRRQLERRAAGEGHGDRRRAHPRGLALEARVEDGVRRRAGRPLHGRRHRLAQRRVHARRQARDHRAGVDDRRQAGVRRRRHGQRIPGDRHPGQLDEVERVVERAGHHRRVRVLPRVVRPERQVPR